MNPFRGYLKAKIQAAQFEKFLSLIPSFTKIVEDTEPNSLQFEAFANASKKEIIWMESYKDNTGFDVHISNPALETLKMEMMPLQEEIIDMYFMSAPSKEALAGLQSYGINPTVPNPWPGTNRLQESSNDDAAIQSMAKLSLNNMEAYRKFSDQLEKHAASQSGVHFHQSYQLNESEIVVLEQYANGEAFLAWADVFAANSSGFNSLVEGLKLEVFGSPTGKCKEALDDWGAIYYHKIAGFTRF